MMTSLRSAATLILSVSAAIAQPCTAQSSEDSATRVREQLRALYPATQFGAVVPTPLPGLYEVALANQLVYVDPTGQFFLFGHLYDMKAQRDITAERKDLRARIDFTALPLEDALKEVRGNGSRVLAMFSDPDCPYCRKLEADLMGLTDVTLYTFLMPLASLHPEARGKAIGVWCAADRVNAWRALMDRGEFARSADCPHPVDRNIALGERLGIAATPTLVSADGRVMAGAAGLAQVEAWLVRRSEAAAQ